MFDCLFAASRCGNDYIGNDFALAFLQANSNDMDLEVYAASDLNKDVTIKVSRLSDVDTRLL